jgi:hypothetical protein
MQHTNNPASMAKAAGYSGEAIMRSTLLAVLMMLGMTGLAAAKDPLPNAPSAVEAADADAMFIEPAALPSSSKVVESRPVVDLKFASLALVSTGSTFADSYTTLFARQNWLAGKKGVCNEEVESAYLYGTHPTVGRAYAVASAKSAISVAAAYYLRKHHSKFWSAPLVANSIISLQGVTQNMRNCN